MVASRLAKLDDVLYVENLQAHLGIGIIGGGGIWGPKTTEEVPPLVVGSDQPLVELSLLLVGLDCSHQPYVPSNWQLQLLFLPIASTVLPALPLLSPSSASVAAPLPDSSPAVTTTEVAPYGSDGPPLALDLGSRCTTTDMTTPPPSSFVIVSHHHMIARSRDGTRKPKVFSATR
ncbi:unnamed protein product [Ilex paraguariensis]|uniref:Uncharacterized protein n=1 Tax=Ilex paraguariensis TaxID=185542 RepID=A0ABC8QP60_9AQUA